MYYNMFYQGFCYDFSMGYTSHIPPHVGLVFATTRKSYNPKNWSLARKEQFLDTFIENMSLEPSELIAAFVSKVLFFIGLGLGVFRDL